MLQSWLLLVLYLFIVDCPDALGISDTPTDQHKIDLDPLTSANHPIWFKKYQRNYFITGFGTQKTPAWLGNKSPHNQVKFQFSFKYVLLDRLWFGFILS